jgi:hypothetical protein
MGIFDYYSLDPKPPLLRMSGLICITSSRKKGLAREDGIDEKTRSGNDFPKDLLRFRIINLYKSLERIIEETRND